MPRGYRRNCRADVGKKESRGGSSKRSGWSRTPGFIRTHKQNLRRERKITLLHNVDFEVQSGLDLYNDEFGLCYDYDNALIETVFCDPEAQLDAYSLGEEVENSCFVKDSVLAPGSNSLTPTPLEPDQSYLFVDNADVVERSDEITENEDNFSFSFCSEDYQASSSDVFSLVSATTSAKENDSFSLISSPCDITVSKTSNQVQKLSYQPNSLVCLANNANDDEHRKPSPRLLFVPKKCAICLEEKEDVLRLMHKCNHPEACMSCLRIHYIDNGVIRHYEERDSFSTTERFSCRFPFKCFWPGCNRTLRDVQIRSLANNKSQQQQIMAKYYCLEVMRKRLKQERIQLMIYETIQHRRTMNFKIPQHCSSCGSTSNHAQPARDKIFTCSQCHTTQPLTAQMSWDEIKSIIDAAGDYLVNCPACKTFIVKDGGCDEMTCVCGEHFSFFTAQIELRKYVGTTRGL